MFGVTGLRYSALIAESHSCRAAQRARARYGFWVLNWVIGHILGGALVGGALGWVGAHIRTSDVGVIAGMSIICLAGAARELDVVRLPLPQLRRQVSRVWMQRLPWTIVALGYGIQLGSGLATRINVATTYAVFACATASGSIGVGALFLSLFGIARSILPALLGPYVAAPDRSISFAVWFSSHESRIRRLNGLLLLGAAVVMTASVVR
jgi:hypothetical protein